MVKQDGRTLLIQIPNLIDLRLEVKKLRKGSHTLGTPCMNILKLKIICNLILTTLRCTLNGYTVFPK